MVIAFAIVALGGAWVYAGYRERMAALGEFARRVEAPQASVQPAPMLAGVDDDRLRDQNRIACAAGEIAIAESTATELLRRHPMDFETRYQLALALGAAGENARAIEHLRFLAALDPAGLPEASRYSALAREALQGR